LLFLPAGAGEPSGDFEDKVSSVSPTIRSMTFVLAPARLNLSSKSATASSVFAVSNVSGSVNECNSVVLFFSLSFLESRGRVLFSGSVSSAPLMLLLGTRLGSREPHMTLRPWRWPSSANFSKPFSRPKIRPYMYGGMEVRETYYRHCVDPRLTSIRPACAPSDAPRS
jgi:hypothetical protein